MPEVYYHRFLKKCKENKSLFLRCLALVFLWGLIAHSYMFFGNAFSHDSLSEFFTSDAIRATKLEAGRVFVPIYETVIRGLVTTPWLVGLCGLTYIACSLFLISKIFNIKRNLLLVLLAGVMTVNFTAIAAIATYLHDFDCDMLALLLSVFAVYLWKRFSYGYLWAMIPLAFAFGLYQAYICVFITLVIFDCILQLLSGAEAKNVLIAGLRALLSLIGATLLYILLAKLVCVAYNNALSTNNYNSISIITTMSAKEILVACGGAVWTTIRVLLTPPRYHFLPASATIALQLLFIGIAGLFLIFRLCSKQIKPAAKLLICALLLALPLGMNICHVLTNQTSHQLMYYAICLTPLLVLLLIFRFPPNLAVCKQFLLPFCGKAICVCLLLLCLCSNVKLANTAYLYKTTQQNATLSLFTAINVRMESTPGYIVGETPVVFVGDINYQLYSSEAWNPLVSLSGFYGLDHTTSLGFSVYQPYRSYYEYVMMRKINLVSFSSFRSFQTHPAAMAMPIYPQEGCIAWIDNVLVIKVGPCEEA